MKQILIMRHGKPEPNLGQDDFSIPLSKSGKLSAAKVGKTILEKGIIPDIIISSHAVRAAETARIVAVTCDYQKEIAFNMGFYFGSTKQAILVLKELPESVHRVLLIGHNPTWAELVHTLQEKPRTVSFNPATLVSLSTNGHMWNQIGKGTCIFEWIM